MIVTVDRANKVLDLLKSTFPKIPGFGTRILHIIRFTEIRKEAGVTIVTFSLPTEEWMQNNYLIVHGGCTATIIDYLTTYAFIADEKYWKDIEDEDSYADVLRAAVAEFGLSRHISTQYLSAIPIGTELFCDVRLESSTSRFTHTSCRLHDGNGKTFATGIHDKVKQVSKRLSKL